MRSSLIKNKYILHLIITDTHFINLLDSLFFYTACVGIKLLKLQLNILESNFLKSGTRSNIFTG